HERARLQIALAELALAESQTSEAGARAAGHARAALADRPGDPEARQVLAAGRGREPAVAALPGEQTGPEARYPLALAIARLLDRRPELVALAAEARAAADDLDQPLLVTIMGEFSSGKSTFINALIGEEVAATGVTPTTATI